MRYKVVELGAVTEETIEVELNRWCNQGWELHDLRFVMREGVRRPSMAFLIFTELDGSEGNALPSGVELDASAATETAAAAAPHATSEVSEAEEEQFIPAAASGRPRRRSR